MPGTAPAVRLQRPLTVLALIGTLWVVSGLAWAEPTTATSAQAREVRSWLARIHEAAARRNFQGTFVVTGGGVASSARIAHYCQGPQQYERSESLDGEPRRVLRHNDLVTTLWPQAKVARIEQRSGVAQFPSLLQDGAERIADHYEVHVGGIERVAGHEAELLLVKPRDALRYGHRLWADRATGLLLRVDVMGGGGEVLESSAFSEVTIGVKPQPEVVLSAMKRLEGYRVFRPVLQPTRLEAEGWAMRRPVPGFEQLSCVRRSWDGEAPHGNAEPARMVQTIFSDGLTYVSMFIEPYHRDRHPKPLSTSLGATQTLMLRHGEWWVTLIGDVPPATLRAFADSVDRQTR